MTSALSITQLANPPRSVFLDYPLGHTAGPPHDPEQQLQIMRTTMAAFSSLTQPSSLHVLPNLWTDDPNWKVAARELKDHRNERFDTPQYQEPADQVAAEQG